jgi:hypothetical protein
VIVFKTIKYQIALTKFRHSKYSLVSGNNYAQTRRSIGNYGEYLTFLYIEKLGEDNRLLANIYIPKLDGTTTEIDILMINKTGIYVFESKNYSGWIFGSEKNQMWTQSLKGGKKEKFYNPILQNAIHIRALNKILNDDYSNYLYSYIVFSERCDLKDVPLNSREATIVKRNQLLFLLNSDIKNRIEILTDNQINEIYNKIEKYCNVENSIKINHIERIKNRH